MDINWERVLKNMGGSMKYLGGGQFKFGENFKRVGEKLKFGMEYSSSSLSNEVKYLMS